VPGDVFHQELDERIFKRRAYLFEKRVALQLRLPRDN
jgi:hypothetical protein